MSPPFRTIAFLLLLSLLATPAPSADPAASRVPLDRENFPETEEEIVAQIRLHVLATKVAESEMADYEAKIPETGAP